MIAALLTPGIQHLIAGLGIIGAVSGLAATGTLTGAEALAIIGPVGGLLLGGTISTAAVAAGVAATTSTAAQAPASGNPVT